MQTDNYKGYLQRIHEYSADILDKQSLKVLPDQNILDDSRNSLLQSLPDQGLGVDQTTSHLLTDIAPALNGQSLSSTYYGFVTGGVTPAARFADNLVSLFDQNVQVHLPDQTISTNVEDRALRLLLELLQFDQLAWSGVFTTGATSGNILGLACGREYVINERLKRRLGSDSQETLGSLGLLEACSRAGIGGISIYTTMAHSSLYKASSILGLGRSSVKDVRIHQHSISFDFAGLEEALARNQHTKVSIVVISCAEVNTGFFATSGISEVDQLRKLCDKFGAWLHVDGAFGIFGRLLEGLPEFETLANGTKGLELADSIAGDGHKLLNVPYDCGFFFCRHPSVAQQVFQNPNAAYLNTVNASTDTVQSPLNVGLENSRRFRGLPVYANLMAYGRQGYVNMLERQIRFARSTAAYLFDSEAFELLPQETFSSKEGIYQHVFIIVLFRAKDNALNEKLVKMINSSCKMYVSGTVWEGRTACRMAVSNWQVQSDRDLPQIIGVLEDVVDRYFHKE